MTGSGEESPTRSTGPNVPTWIKVTLAGVTVLVFALVAAVVMLALKVSDSHDPVSTDDDAGSDVDSSFMAVGEVTLTSYDGVFNAGGGECTGTGSYDDIAAGAQVVIRNSVGQTLAADSLGRGQKQGPSTCVFPFEVEVPTDDGPYSVEVAHRGEIAFNEADAEGLHLTLG